MLAAVIMGRTGGAVPAAASISDTRSPARQRANRSEGLFLLNVCRLHSTGTVNHWKSEASIFLVLSKFLKIGPVI